jgi:hypothetical protein
LGQHQGQEPGLFFGGHFGDGLGRSHGARVVDSSFGGNWNLAHWGLVVNMEANRPISSLSRANWSSTGCLR